MSKIKIYNAVSLDGYIAGDGSNTEWVSETDWNSLKKELEIADCVVMGSVTFEAIERDPNDSFPYGGCKNYVFTSREVDNKWGSMVEFVSDEPKEFMEKVKGCQNILCVGGGKLNASLMNAELVGEVITTIHPVVLGGGVELFDGLRRATNLNTKSVEQLEDGVVKVVYEVV